MNNNNNIIADAYQAVEVRIAGIAATGQTQTQWSFPDLPYLRPNMAFIQAIEYYSVNAITFSPVSGTANVSLAIAQKTAVTLYGGIEGVKQGNQIVQQMPILRLNNMQDAVTSPFSHGMMKFRDLQVDWTKSMLNIASAPANTTDMAFVFGVYFNFAAGSLMNDYR